MTLRALRAAALGMGLALIAWPAMMAAAPASTASKPSVRPAAAAPARPATIRRGTSQGSSGKTAVRRTIRRRGRRPPPAGGVYARNAILIDPSTGEVLFEKNSSAAVPIASLTKLMTALVFLEQKPDMERETDVTPEDLAGAGHTQLRRGERPALGDLMHMSLMCSDNVATRILARESGLSAEDFLARMNKKAAELGLESARFVEFTGLDERNVATASDVARLLHAAAHDETIQSITTTRSYEFRTTRRWHTISNTNRLLYSQYDVLGGKTGFILEAGYCFATWVRSQGRDLIAVVLGAPTNATRFADAVRLIRKSTVPPAITTRS